MKTFVFLAPGFEEIEALTVVDYLRRAGENVVTVSVPTDGNGKSNAVVTGAHKIPVIADRSFQDFVSGLGESVPDAIYFPGGMPGASNLAANQFLFNLTIKMERKGKLVAALCAAPAVVLAPTGILAGRKWTCYPGMENNLGEYCGSQVKAAELTENSQHISNVPFVLDNNVLTGRGPGAAEQFAMKMVELLAGKETAEKVHAASVQR